MTAAEGDTADSGEEDADTGSGTDAEGTAASDGGAVLNDTLPITETAPYEYVGESGSSERTALSTYIKTSAGTLGLTAVQDAVSAARTANEQNPQYDAEGNEIDQEAALDATTIISASEFISTMRSYMEENLGMPTGLPDADVRTLVGLYYSMRQVGFSQQRDLYAQADNISMDLIA